MIGAPWYLSAAGMMLVIVGILAGAVRGASSSRTAIDPRMSDAEIARRLHRRSSGGIPALLIYAGLACLAVGAIWRFARWFV